MTLKQSALHLAGSATSFSGVAAPSPSAREFRVTTPRQILLCEPRAGAPQTSEILFGEAFAKRDRRDGWTLVENATDGHVGWTRLTDPVGEPCAPTDLVSALRSKVHPRADFRAVPDDALSIGSRVAVMASDGDWSAIGPDRWVFSRHLQPLKQPLRADPVTTALRFLDTPYVWGGRSAFGVDCSGLIQIAMAFAGVTTDHDSERQRTDERLGTLISPDGSGVEYERGDIVFFPGHVGMMLDRGTLLHATVFTMSVTTEPVAAVAARAQGIIGVRRPLLAKPRP